MRLQRIGLVLVLFGCGCCVISSGQAQGSATRSSVTVHYDFPNLSLTVTQPSSLQTVLNELCERTQAECSGIEQTASYKVAPTTFRGAWSDVVNQLMEGAALNYAAGPPSRSQVGTLIIQGQRASLPAPSGAPAQASYPESTMQAASANTFDANSVPGSGSTQANEGSSVDHESSSASMARMSTGGNGFTVGGSTTGPSVPPSGMQLGPLGGYMPINAPAEPPAFLPFPDRNGNLIPVSNVPPQYLPFPDSHGNLVPVDPNAPSGSPFPDSAIHRSH